LLLPPSRAEVEPPELPDLDAAPEFELPRASELRSELPFPNREFSRPFAIDRSFAAALILPRFVAWLVLCEEKKC